MKTTAQIEQDGRLLIDVQILREAGLAPGELVEISSIGNHLMVSRERSVENVFQLWRGADRSRPPMSLDEIVAEQRETRGHDELD